MAGEDFFLDWSAISATQDHTSFLDGMQSHDRIDVHETAFNIKSIFFMFLFEDLLWSVLNFYILPDFLMLELQAASSKDPPQPAVEGKNSKAKDSKAPQVLTQEPSPHQNAEIRWPPYKF